MDVWDLTKLLARRWYFTVPFLLLTVIGVVYLAKTTEPDYALTSHVLLTPPPPSGTGSEADKAALTSNPWNSLGTTALAQAGKLSIEGEDVVKSLADRGLSDSYVVTLDNWSPIITLEVVSANPNLAMTTTDTLISMFQTNVTELQKSQGAVDSALIKVQRLPGDKLEARDSNVKRAVVAVGAAGTLLACALTIGLDALLRRRRRPSAGPVLSAPSLPDMLPLAPSVPGPVSLPLPPAPSQPSTVWTSPPVTREPLTSSAPTTSPIPPVPGTSRAGGDSEPVPAPDSTVVLPLSLGRGGKSP